jgi:ubiquinol-cytochrome c reductase cytochrome b subunit
MAEDTAKPAKKFYPEQMFKDTVATFAYVMVLVLFANFAKLGLGSMADPTDTRYIPRPEWYFLFLFETLKLLQGPLEVLGAVVLPNLGIVALFLVPFLDRGRAIRVRQRTVAIALAAFAVVGWAALTERAVATTPPSMEDPDAGLRPPPPWRELPPEELAAIGYFASDNCTRCHVLGRSMYGPDLAKDPSTKPADWLIEHFTKPSPDSPESHLTGAQKKNLVTLVTKRDDRALDAWENPPSAAIAGALVYQTRGCAFCHLLNGSGAKMAPVLNGVAARRTRTWVAEHFADPPKLSPGSAMPAYKFNPQDLAAITDYLMAIPK